MQQLLCTHQMCKMVCPILETIFICIKELIVPQNARSCCQHIFFHHFSSVFTCSSPMSSSNMLSSRPTHSGGFTLCRLGSGHLVRYEFVRIRSSLHSYRVSFVQDVWLLFFHLFWVMSTQASLF